MAVSPIFINPFRVEQTVLIAAHGTGLALIGWTAGSSGSRIHAISVAIAAKVATISKGLPSCLRSMLFPSPETVLPASRFQDSAD